MQLFIVYIHIVSLQSVFSSSESSPIGEQWAESVVTHPVLVTVSGT